MEFVDQIKGLIASGKIQETSINMLEDVIHAVLGDPVSTGKIIIALAKSPFSSSGTNILDKNGSISKRHLSA